MREILIILDGMEDVEYESLGGKTPFEYANCVHLGLINHVKQVSHTVKGRETNSQTCIMALLGVEEEYIPTGRAYLEAVSRDIPVGDGDLLLRLNGVETDEKGRVAGACSLEGFDFFSCGHDIFLLSDYRGILKIPEGKRFLEGMETFAPYKNHGRDIEGLFSKGNRLGEELADFSRLLLRRYKNRTVIPWSPSVKSPFPKLYDPKNSAAVCAADISRGIAKALGMKCVTPESATGDVDTDLEEKCRICLRLHEDYDFVLLHINGLDEASHRRDPHEKAEFLSAIDQLVIGPIKNSCLAGTKLTITSDHATLCRDGEHSPMPVRQWEWEV